MTKKVLYDSIFVLITIIICHFLFSKYGFNPTDEGFVLSATNRVLHGQIPHLDFSSVRPLGYAYLHIPELMFSKKYFFLISRFVFWTEQVLIAYGWVYFITKHKRCERYYTYILTVVCLIFNVHYFPCSVLHTIDGLLFCIIGWNIISSEKKWNIIGYFFIGFAALCKQNYLIVLPFAILIFGKKNTVLKSIIGITPIIIYVVFIALKGGFSDLLLQLSGHSELLKVGVGAYVLNPLWYLGILVGCVFLIPYINHKFIVYILWIYAIIILTTNHYHGKFIFLFFGIGCSLYIEKIITKKPTTSILVALLLAWAVSISVGYNTPSLFTGGLIVLLIYTVLPRPNKIILVLTFATVIAFIYTRLHNIYRDCAASQLLYPLDDLVEGANGIYTNKNTYTVLNALDKLKKKNPNNIVVPDFTACNILHAYQSKILTEWPNKTEIPNNVILAKVTANLLQDSAITIIVPIYQTALLKDGFTPFLNNGDDYAILSFVKKNYRQTDTTLYFKLYHH